MEYDRQLLIKVVTYHFKRDIKGCVCGWAVLGESCSAHVADEYEKALRLKERGCVEFDGCCSTHSPCFRADNDPLAGACTGWPCP